MVDFNFQNPTRIIFGKGMEKEIGHILTEYKIKKVLFLYGGGSIKRSGLFKRVMERLAAENISVVEFGGVSSNPILDHAREAIQLAKTNYVDAILPVGGGSVIDEAKAVAVGAKTERDIWEFYTGTPVKDALPIFTIVTLAAACSHMNFISVLTNKETKVKTSMKSPCTYPKVSIMNPELTYSVPVKYKVYSAVDTISHAIEPYFTRTYGTGLQDGILESVINATIDSTKKILNDPEHYNAHAEYMWAATVAHNGFGNIGIGGFSYPNHMFEHPLSAIYDIPHGAGLSIVMPAWMKWYVKKIPHQFVRFAKKVFQLEKPEDGINALENWFVHIGAPTRLKDVGINPADIPMITEHIYNLGRLWGIADKYPEKVIAEILALMK